MTAAATTGPASGAIPASFRLVVEQLAQTLLFDAMLAAACAKLTRESLRAVPGVLLKRCEQALRKRGLLVQETLLQLRDRLREKFFNRGHVRVHLLAVNAGRLAHRL
jgi:hypothetical protein